MDDRRPALSASQSRASSFASYPYSTPSSSSILGKRSAPNDDAPSSRKALGSSTSITALQNKIQRLETDNHILEASLKTLNEDNAKLTSERKTFFDGEKYERNTGQEREEGFGVERSQLAKQIKDLRQALHAKEDRLEDLEIDHSKLKKAHALYVETSGQERIGHEARIRELMGDVERLKGFDRAGNKSRIRELEVEVDRLKGFERRAAALAIQMEEQKRMSGQSGEAQGGQGGGGEDMRKELRRQSGVLQTLERNHSAMQTEVIELRQKKKEADAAERAHKDVERALRDEVRQLQDQLDRSRRDMDSLTQTFSSPSTPSADIKTLQSRILGLTTLLNQANTDIAKKEFELNDLHDRQRALSSSSAAALAEVGGQLKEKTRELRWALQREEGAERREDMLKREIHAMRSDVDVPTGTADAKLSDDSRARVKQLESIVDQYKAELDEMTRDSRALEDRLTDGAGLVKQTLLVETQDKVSQLETDIHALESTIAELTTANTTLDAEVNDLMRRVASGEYNPSSERCLQLRDNPASKIHVVRKSQLDDLKRENEALLERLKSSVVYTPDQAIPVESFERLKKEKEDLEVAHGKRLQRLKEIFGNKSKEFLEAVHSLLGWRIKFDDAGGDIRLTSMYAPKGKMGLTLKFASQEGHFGTMQMMGGMARGLEESRQFWIIERQSVPGFLAQVTTEMFEKTTIGRAAGYVGLE